MKQTLTASIAALTLLYQPSLDGAGSRYSQIVIPLFQTRPFDYHFNKTENTISLKVNGTKPEELEPLYNYDSRLIKRLIVKEQAKDSTEISIVLADKNIKAAIYSFDEPFRIVIDLYDKDYQEALDPHATKDPLVEMGGNNQLMVDQYKDQELTAKFSEQKESLQQNREYEDTISTPTSKQSIRRLLQPAPKEFQNSQQLQAILDKAPEGRGRNWKDYPQYIYPIQTHSLHSGKNYESWQHSNTQQQDLSSGPSLANYAAELYGFGHHHKALIVYQKVLHSFPLEFDRNPQHIWNLGEIHFGIGNNTLADGYYRSLLDKHPDSPLAKYAMIRQLDTRAIAAQENKTKKVFKTLSEQLDLVKSDGLPELQALIALRKAYWDQSPDDLDTNFSSPFQIPKISNDNRQRLEQSVDKAENPRSAFLISTILLENMLEEQGWNARVSTFTTAYFSRFKGTSTEPYRSRLEAKTRKNVSKNIVDLAKGDKSLEAINIIKNLPGTLQQTAMSRDLSWSIAESYRKIQQDEKAIPYYQKALQLSKSTEEKINAAIMKALSTKNTLEIYAATGKNRQSSKIKKQLASDDKKIEEIWKSLDQSNKFEISKKYKDKLTKNLNDSVKLLSFNIISLWAWSQSINGATNQGEWNASYKTTGETVFALSKLSKEFQRNHDQDRFQAAKNLLKNIDPESFNDPGAEKLWANELVELAELHRNKNNYLEAGRIYTLTGQKSKNWDKRAEALYKGGLLLYRSGRREEAMKAFESAAGDGNNLLYADLAKKRLEQLKQ